MNDKIYVLNFFASVFFGMILLTIIIWFIPEMDYFDGEYPSWKQQRDYTHTKGSESQILFIGDSAFKAAVIPELIDDSAYNLSLGGASPLEMYYALNTYLKNHPKPKQVFISFGPMHFMYLKRYQDRTLYFHFLDPKDQIESQINIFRLDDTPFLDMLSMSLENIQYMIKFPTKYFQTIKTSELKRGEFNQDNYDSVSEQRGHMYFGLDPQWFNHYEPHEQLQREFKLLQSEDFYIKKLLHLCLDNDIPVRMVQTPVNKMTYETTQKYNQFQSYQEYLKKLSKEMNVEIETDLIFYDINLFGEHLHLNEKGAEIYSKNFKEKFF